MGYRVETAAWRDEDGCRHWRCATLEEAQDLYRRECERDPTESVWLIRGRTILDERMGVRPKHLT